MFLIAGISAKVKPLCPARTDCCPACGQDAPLQVIHKYMTPHIFFIPTFRFHSEYVATCLCCASLLEIGRERGRMLAREREPMLHRGELRLLQNNYGPRCAHCGAKYRSGDSFCPHCGGRI